MTRTGFIFALIFVAVLTAIAAIKAHADQPLLIDAPVHQADANAPPAWRLYTTCPVDRRNVPTLPDDRRA